MRTIDPSLNHGWLDSAYLRAFQFAKLGENVAIHRTVVMPPAKNIEIGDNVVIGPLVVIECEQLVIGNNCQIKAGCILAGGLVDLPDESIVDYRTVIIGDPIEYEEPKPTRKGRKHA